MNEEQLLMTAIQAACAAGEEILDVYTDEFSVDYKEDKSPLTMADRRAHQAIVSRLSETGLPVLSEEGKNIPFGIRRHWQKFWLVDPLDGTKEFIKRNGEFTVNIALIDAGRPVAGIILVPVTKVLYFASQTTGAWKTILRDSIPDHLESLMALSAKLPEPRKYSETFTVVASRSHISPETMEFVDHLKETHRNLQFVSVGSSLKLCLIAEGQADIYPRFGPTMEWDTAAGHAIVECSGGYVTLPNESAPVQYNKENLLNPWFIAGRNK